MSARREAGRLRSCAARHAVHKNASGAFIQTGRPQVTPEPGSGDLMNIDLSGKKAVVSGSTAGIGFAIARGLASSGADVVINGRSDKSVEAAIARLAKEGARGKVEGVAAD